MQMKILLTAAVLFLLGSGEYTFLSAVPVCIFLFI